MSSQTPTERKGQQIAIGVLMAGLFVPFAYLLLWLGAAEAIGRVVIPMSFRFPWPELTTLVAFQIVYLAVVHTLYRVLRAKRTGFNTVVLIMLIFDVILSIVLVPYGYRPCM